jgi:hypothetical protein
MRTGFTVGALCVQILLAVSVTQVRANCLKPPLSVQSINQFKSNPQALVAPDSDARTVEAMTRDLAGSDAALAADLVRLAKGAAPRFQTAIAAGLAQAAIACANVDQEAALLIQQAVASFQEGSFQAAFAAVAGDLSTAATEAATAFATASVGSVVVTNPVSSHVGATNPAGGGISATFQPTSTILILGSTVSTNIASTTAATSVSPIR